jgi:hypothetical protein
MFPFGRGGLARGFLPGRPARFRAKLIIINKIDKIAAIVNDY